ncbi:MAG: glutamine synthetase family protein [Candidatus Hydrothermarchaeales archaeon]
MASHDAKVKKILEAVKEKDIHFVKFQFTDILGILKSFAVPASELEVAMDEGMGFDGSSIMGYTPIEESDMIAMPDLDTFQILPWRPREGGVARLICDIKLPEGGPFEGDPRYVLRRAVKEAEKKGFQYNLGPELEYFYFKTMDSPELIDRGGYFDSLPLDLAEDLRRETILTLEEMGIMVEYSHHEVSASQHEIDLCYADALSMADYAITYRLVVKAIAQKLGVFASFMPKPIYGVNGSGMHTHQSLFDLKTKKNAFYDADDPDGWYLSDTAKYFIAGQLKYAKEITGILAQWVNSYKRLVPGYEAPVYVSWARRNRSALIRVPLYKPGKESATRAEYRAPDPACNQYLAFAVMLMAGLAGIENKEKLPKPIERDIFHLTREERRDLGITELPGSLADAIKEIEGSELMRRTLGEHTYENWLKIKKDEWDDYRIQVHKWELDKYLHLL